MGVPDLRLVYRVYMKMWLETLTGRYKHLAHVQYICKYQDSTQNIKLGWGRKGGGGQSKLHRNLGALWGMLLQQI